MITTILLSFLIVFNDPPIAPAQLFRSEEGLQVLLPDWILNDEEVLEQFKSGLTNTFILKLSIRARNGASFQGAARIEIRYELWDEVFLINILEGDGKRTTHNIPNLKAFRQWWKASAFTILPPPSSQYATNARITLDFIPFSQSEQNHARAWLTDSNRGNIQNNGEQASQVTNIFQTIMATSIQSKPIWSHRWNVTLSGNKM